MVAAILMMLAAAIAAPAQKFTLLHSFDSTDGANPIGVLVQATNGNLYGTTYFAGPNSYGTVFKIADGDRLTTLYGFDLADGAGWGGANYGDSGTRGTNREFASRRRAVRWLLRWPPQSDLPR